MSISLSVLLAQVDSEISGIDSELAEYRRLRVIKAAVSQYERDVPQEIVEDVTGDGGRYYALASELTSWVEGGSYVRSVEYPAATVADDDTPQLLDPEAWDANYFDGSTRYLYFPMHSPAATEAFRVRYTAPLVWSAATATTDVEQGDHGLQADDYVYFDGSLWLEADDILIATHQVSAAADADNFTVKVLQVTIPASDFFAVCKLGAAMCAEAIAAKYSRTSDTTITADSVQHLTRAQQWAARARDFAKQYREMLGLPAPGEKPSKKPAGTIVQWQTKPEHTRRYLFHNRN